MSSEPEYDSFETDLILLGLILYIIFVTVTFIIWTAIILDKSKRSKTPVANIQLTEKQK